MAAEDFSAAEGGEECREEGGEEGVLRPVGGVGDFGKEGFDSGELGTDDLPAGGEGGDGKGGGEEMVKEVGDGAESFGRRRRRRRSGGGEHFC